MMHTNSSHKKQFISGNTYHINLLRTKFSSNYCSCSQHLIQVQYYGVTTAQVRLGPSVQMTSGTLKFACNVHLTLVFNNPLFWKMCSCEHNWMQTFLLLHIHKLTKPCRICELPPQVPSPIPELGRWQRRGQGKGTSWIPSTQQSPRAPAACRAIFKILSQS